MSISDQSAFPAIAGELRQIVDAALVKLRSIADDRSARPLAPASGRETNDRASHRLRGEQPPAIRSSAAARRSNFLVRTGPGWAASDTKIAVGDSSGSGMPTINTWRTSSARSGSRRNVPCTIGAHAAVALGCSSGPRPPRAPSCTASSGQEIGGGVSSEHEDDSTRFLCRVHTDHRHSSRRTGPEGWLLRADQVPAPQIQTHLVPSSSPRRDLVHAVRRKQLFWTRRTSQPGITLRARSHW
jgi:hypothetical protein